MGIEYRNKIALGGGEVSVDPNGKITLTPASGQDVEVASGQLFLQDGSGGAPSLAFASDEDTGVFLRAANDMVLGRAGNRMVRVAANVEVNAGVGFALGTGQPPSANNVQLFVTAGDILEQRRGTNAQERRLYNTFTDASNHEYLALLFSANVPRIQPVAAGTGTPRNLQLASEDGTLAIDIGTAGEIGLFGATPVAQPTVAGTGAAAFVAGAGTGVNDDSTFGGWTLAEVVQALLDLGILG